MDTVAPAGYSLILDAESLDEETASDTGFWIIDSEAFAYYSFTITSDGGDGSVTGSGQTTLIDYHVADVDVSSLPDGLLTISVKLIDEAGNESDAVTTTIELNQSE